MRHVSLYRNLLKVLLLTFCFAFGTSSCGTQVGNPTDNDEPPKNSPNKPQETQSATPPKNDANPTEGSNASNTQDSSKPCVVSVASEPLTSPEMTGSLTIILLPAVDFSASITPPGLNPIEGKTLSFTSSGVYKFTVVPALGTACSAEISIDSNLVQKMVSATVTLP